MLWNSGEILTATMPQVTFKQAQRIPTARKTLCRTEILCSVVRSRTHKQSWKAEEAVEATAWKHPSPLVGGYEGSMKGYSTMARLLELSLRRLSTGVKRTRIVGCTFHGTFLAAQNKTTSNFLPALHLENRQRCPIAVRKPSPASSSEDLRSWAYLCLKIKGQHGKAEVQHEILGLKTLQGPTDTEGHHALALNEDNGTDHIEGTD